jgi:alpha-beta hydrolase superfamily lysophospholipase
MEEKSLPQPAGRSETLTMTLTSTTVWNSNKVSIHVWNPPSVPNPSSKTPIILLYHGFLAHGLYPTVRYAAEALCRRLNCIVIAPDLPGHGKSEGLKGYLSSSKDTIACAVEIAQWCRDWQEKQNCSETTTGNSTDTIATDTEKGKNASKTSSSWFLVGSSLGGNIALRVAQEWKKEQPIAGVVLLAPMLSLSVSPWEQWLLKGMAHILPTLQIIPRSSSPEKQYRDPVKCQECIDDDNAQNAAASGMTSTKLQSHDDASETTPHHRRKTWLRVGSAQTCVELASEISSLFPVMDFPWLCLVANQDAIVDSKGAMTFMESSPSKDKTIKHYDALHGLMCEPKPLLDEIEGDMCDWISARI